MSGKLWEVKGGGASGGLLVRTEKDTKSPEHPDGRLAKGSIIAELNLDGERLYYTLLAGGGPLEGWISTKLKGKDLLLEVGAPGSKAALEEEDLKKAVEQSQSSEGKRRKVVWIMAAGTRGDIQPMMPLGIGLRKAGYHVRVLTAAHGKAMVEACGLAYTEQGVNYQDHMSKQLEKADTYTQEEAEEFMEDFKERQVEMGFEGLFETAFNDEILGGSARIINELLKEETPDFIFTHFLNSCLPWIAVAKCKCPVYQFEYIALDPSVPPDADLENDLKVWQKHAKWMEDAIGVDPLAEFGFDRYKDYRANKVFCFQKRMMFDFSPPMGEEKKAAAYNAHSEEWFQSYFKGSLILDPTLMVKDLKSFGGIETLRKLHDFIKAGPKPIYIGFGSMPVPITVLVKLMTTLKLQKGRAIILEGYGKFSFENFKKEVLKYMPNDDMGLLPFAQQQLFVPVASHEWLFPRCALTVHHGGAGTTTAAIRAGVPTLIIPLAVDQFCFANFVEAVGIGGKLSLTEKMDQMMDPVWSKLIRKLSTDKDVIGRAKAIGAHFLEDDTKPVRDMVEEIGKIIDKEKREVPEPGEEPPPQAQANG